MIDRLPLPKLALLVCLAASSVGVLAARPALAADPAFDSGVAAGEVTSNSAKVWGRSLGKGRVRVDLGLDRRFRQIQKAATVKTKAKNDGTVQKVFKGLKPRRQYWYQFCKGSQCSEKGTFTTPPSDSRAKRVKFALSGDADSTPAAGETKPFFGKFQVMQAMRRERNDFNVFMGDTIYSDSGVDGGPPALTVEEKWDEYERSLKLRHLRKLRRSAAIFTHWDDHEFINDFSIPEHGQEIYDAGVKAFTDYAPVDYSQGDGLYRTVRWGKNVELFFLDQRSFRDAKASANDTCDNPQTGSPDLAPTAPDDKRALFALLIPSFSEPVPQACLDAINDPGRSLLGADQLQRFLDDVEASDARWKIVMNETPIQQFYGLPYDRWEGYAHERIELLDELEERGVEDLLFMTTDTHASFVNVIRKRTFDGDKSPANAPPGPTDTTYGDYVVGPVATNSFYAEVDEVTGEEGNGETLAAAFFKPQPPNGVGMACAQGDRYSYAQVAVGKRGVKITYKDENGAQLLDTDGTECGPYKIKRDV